MLGHGEGACSGQPVRFVLFFKMVPYHVAWSSLELVIFLLASQGACLVPGLSSSFETFIFIVLAGVLLGYSFLCVAFSECVSSQMVAGLSLWTQERETPRVLSVGVVW